MWALPGGLRGHRGHVLVRAVTCTGVLERSPDAPPIGDYTN